MLQSHLLKPNEKKKQGCEFEASWLQPITPRQSYYVCYVMTMCWNYAVEAFEPYWLAATCVGQGVVSTRVKTSPFLG